MEGEIESEPLALKNIPDIVNRQLVRVSVLYSRENSRKKVPNLGKRMVTAHPFTLPSRDYL